MKKAALVVDNNDGNEKTDLDVLGKQFSHFNQLHFHFFDKHLDRFVKELVQRCLFFGFVGGLFRVG